MIRGNLLIFAVALLIISVCLLLRYWDTLIRVDYQISNWNRISATSESISFEVMNPQNGTFSATKVNRIPRNGTASKSIHNFIYLIQTESCLPKYLLGPGLFGNGNKRDVIILSWKRPCTQHHHHVKYNYKKKTTWSEGRNLLYHQAKSISMNYAYYIFMDDDLNISFTEPSFERRYLRLGIRWPLRAFEDFLLKHEPAIGVPMFCSTCSRINKITGKPETLCCDPVKSLKPLPEYLPVTIHFDAAFTAFHRNAVDFMLPYRLDYERQSWWQSQKFLVLAADLLFRGQILRFTPVLALNKEHREYPRQDWDNWGHMYNILKEEIPKKYREQVNWTPNYGNINVRPIVRNNTVFTPMFNITIPSGKTGVQPFKHFET